jgi:predicted RNA methylase
VYGVDASRAAIDAEQLVRANGMSDVITIVRGKVEEVELPEKVDIIISEPMGTLLLNERMIESLIAARDRFMKHNPDGTINGKMFPNNSTIFLAPFRCEVVASAGVHGVSR